MSRARLWAADLLASLVLAILIAAPVAAVASEDTSPVLQSPPTRMTSVPAASSFVDVASSYPYYAQINALASMGIVSGYGNGIFGPNQPLTRQQFAKMIVRTLDLPVSESDTSAFIDVAGDLDPSDPLYPDHYVAVAAAYHITEGKTPITFAPYDNLTRAQLITMVARAAGLPDPPQGYTPSFGNFSPDHYPWARKAAYAGLLEGLQGMGSSYDFWRSATRGEACALLYTLLGKSTHLYSGDVIAHKIFRGESATSGTTAIYGSGINGATLTDLTFETSHYGLRIGSGLQSTNIVADGLTFRHLAEPILLANVSDSTFTNLDIQADKFPTNKWHGIYLERGNHNLTFKNVKISGGSGYCLQLYYSGGGSDNILFDGLTLDATTGRYPLIIQGYSHVVFRNLTIIGAPGSDGPLIRFYGDSDDVTFDGFTASGGTALVSWSYSAPTNVTFRNGTYAGPVLIEPGQEADFTLENVKLE